MTAQELIWQLLDVPSDTEVMYVDLDGLSREPITEVIKFVGPTFVGLVPAYEAEPHSVAGLRIVLERIQHDRAATPPADSGSLR